MSDSYFGEYACVFPGKMGISWKLASGPWDDLEKARDEAEKNCNVAVVPWEFWERYKEYEGRMVAAEAELSKLKELNRFYKEETNR